MRDGGKLFYAGGVGTGFDEQQLRQIRARLEPDRRPSAPCDGMLPKDRESNARFT